MQKSKFHFHFRNKKFNVLLDIFGQCFYYLVTLENAVKCRHAMNEEQMWHQ